MYVAAGQDNTFSYAQVGVLPGHWAERVLTQDNVNVTAAWACEPREACLGGVASECRYGHQGPLCSTCIDGFTFDGSGLCEPKSGEETDATVPKIVQTFTVAGSPEEFNVTAFKEALASVAHVNPSEISLSVQAGSIQVEATIRPQSYAASKQAQTSLTTLAKQPKERASEALGVKVESVSDPATSEPPSLEADSPDSVERVSSSQVAGQQVDREDNLSAILLAAFACAALSFAIGLLFVGCAWSGKMSTLVDFVTRTKEAVEEVQEQAKVASIARQQAPAIFRILLVFVQITSSFVTTLFAVEWPPAFTALCRMLDKVVNLRAIASPLFCNMHYIMTWRHITYVCSHGRGSR